MNHKKFAHFMRSITVVSLIILALAMVSNCKHNKGVSQDDLIVLTMTQTQWGLNYSSSMGHVEVFLQGGSADGIILASIEMKGDNPSAAPLEPETADFVSGNRVRALFEKNRVLALLASPAEGSIHIVIVSFKTEPGNESFEVTIQVTVSSYVDDGDTSPLNLKIKPDEWNLNFCKRAGTVEAFIEGQGYDQIDIDSIEMMGDNPSAAPLEVKVVDIKPDHIIARFRKSQVIDLLLDPAPGSTHTIFVTYLFTGGTERMELSDVITIEEDDDSIDPRELKLDIRPDEWNLNFYERAGSVEAFIEGQGFDQIDIDSIEMMGDNLSAAPLPVDSVNVKADHIIARFPKNQVLDLLLNPAPGTTHTIIVSFLEIGGTERKELSEVISIEDEEDDDIFDPTKLKLEIDPDEWNLDFPNSTGTVEAFIEGTGLDQVDLSSIEMMGDNLSAAPLAADSASIIGDTIHAKFPMNRVIDLLLNPGEGSTHIIIVSFLLIDGERFELTAEITIEKDEDDGGEGGQPSDLKLELSPPDWNMNFYNENDIVTAKIQGKGLEYIDLGSLEMEGDNPSAAPLKGAQGVLEGNGSHVKTNFPKNKVLDLLLNPAEGTKHTVTVTFLVKGGNQRMGVSARVSVQ